MKKSNKKNSEIIWQNTVYKNMFFKDSGKGSDKKALICKNLGEENEEWFDSVFENKLLSTSPHLFVKKGELDD